MENSISLEKRVDLLEERNKRVEKEKAWEVSVSRRLFLFCLIYISAFLFIYFSRGSKPWLGALFPPIGLRGLYF